MRSPWKSVKRASVKTQIIKTSFRRVLRKRLQMNIYRLLLVQVLIEDDKRKPKEVSEILAFKITSIFWDTLYYKNNFNNLLEKYILTNHLNKKPIHKHS